MKKIAAFIALFSALQVLPAQAGDTQALVDRIIAAYGGEAVWRATRGMEQEGSTYSQRRHFAGKSTRSFLYPDKLKIDIRYNEKDTELRQLDGGQAWDHGELASGSAFLAVRLQAMRLMLPRLLIEQRDRVRDMGQREDENGQRFEGLMVELEDGMSILMDVNLESGRISASWGRMALEGKVMEFSSLYEELRMAEGRLIPHKETHFVQGDNVGYTLVDEVRFVDSFPKNTFRPAE